MTDVHTHILPYVDDGASDMQEAIRLLERGGNEGIKTFILTPHIRSDSDWDKTDKIKKTFAALGNEAVKRGFKLELILGAEILLTPDLPDRLKGENAVAINGRYVLIELPFLQLPIYTEDALFRLLMKGFIPIIAHPERYMYLKGKNEIIGKWVENGVMIQINTGSLDGLYGTKVKRSAKRLLKAGLVHFMGSDIHSDKKKDYGFRQGAETLKKIAGQAGFNKMLIDNPAELIKA